MASYEPPTMPEQLQRRAEERLRPDWADAARADAQTQYVVARGTRHLVRAEPQTGIAFVQPGSPLLSQVGETRQLLLGWFRGRRCVLLDLPEELSFEPPGTRYEELRPLLGVLPQEEAQLLTMVRALVIWRARHRHCGVCGAPTASRSAGHLLACTSSSCGAEFYPRIEPAIIVLVTDGRRALLGRQSSWPPGRYSTLAGFVEPGETLEQAVAREVSEETGAQVRSTRYFASQPWPFPASLMLGFHAHASEGPIQRDGELEDARWFDAEELRSPARPLLPPPHTIAHRLIEAWLEGLGEAAALPGAATDLSAP